MSKIHLKQLECGDDKWTRVEEPNYVRGLPKKLYSEH